MPPKKQDKPKLTKAETLIKWIETNLCLPDGAHAGEPVRLLPFQKDFLKLVFDNPHGTRRAALSIPRKNGKSVLISCLMLAYLCGPLHVKNAQLYSCAMDRDQASQIFSYMCKMITASPRLQAVCEIVDTARLIRVPLLGTTFKSLPRNEASLHGKSTLAWVYDEVGRITASSDRLQEAMTTSQAAHAEPIEFYISTQAESDSSMFSRILDSYRSGIDPQNVAMVFECPVDVDPLSEEALVLANPAWRFLNRNELRSQQRQAKNMPHLLPAFRNLHLNQRVSPDEHFVSEEVWKEGALPISDWHGKDITIALDLSKTTDLTAMSICWYDDEDVNATTTISTQTHFWLPADGLEHRTKIDKIEWSIWRDRGFLSVCPGPVIDYSFVAAKLMEYVRGAKSVRIYYDAYYVVAFKTQMLEVGFTEEFITKNMIVFPQNFKHISPAINAVERILLNKRVRHNGNPILGLCARNVTIVKDHDGNRKLKKDARDLVIDGFVTFTMAASKLVEGEPQNMEPGSYLDEEEDLLFL